MGSRLGLEAKRQAGGDEIDAVGHRRQALVQGTRGIDESPRQRVDWHDAEPDLARDEDDGPLERRQDRQEATAYNALVTDWTELTRQAAAIHDTVGDRQIKLDI